MIRDSKSEANRARYHIAPKEDVDMKLVSHQLRETFLLSVLRLLLTTYLVHGILISISSLHNDGIRIVAPFNVLKCHVHPPSSIAPSYKVSS